MSDLIRKCADSLSEECSGRDFLRYYPDQMPKQYEDAVMAVLNVLIVRGYVTEDGLREISQSQSKDKVE